MFGIPYELLVATHVTAFIFNIALVMVSDMHGLLWMRGLLVRLPQKRMTILHRLIGAGLAVSILTGVILFSMVSEYLLTVPAFYTKLCFVAALVVNAFVIGKHIKIAEHQAYSEISANERRTLIISGTVSSISWGGAFISALFLGL